MTGAGVGSTGSQTTRLVKRLRAMTPPWAISRREARWIAERQARLLLANAGVTAPPVPERIVSELYGVTVYPMAQMPVKGLLGASKPNSRGGDILIDNSLPLDIAAGPAGALGRPEQFPVPVLPQGAWRRRLWSRVWSRVCAGVCG